MTPSLYTQRALERSRRHFINSYPPFNITRRADGHSLDSTEDLLLYVHVPYCPTICTYCFYKKFGKPSASQLDTYLDYLKREIAMFAARPEVSQKRVRTLYIGGGTPTVLSSEQLTELMACLRSHLNCETLEEFCCEIMPHRETASAEKLATLKALGVTRISFGVETFNEELLRVHNRPCTRELYEWTYEKVRDLHFDKINIDVMSGLAGASWDSWRADVDTLLAWDTPSVSIYKTEVFYNTTMYTGIRNGKAPSSLISDEEEKAHIQYAYDTLHERGGYIIGDCLHLIKTLNDYDLHYRYIWQGGEFKGLGLSAHSSYSGLLHQNTSDLADYFALIDAGQLPIHRAYRLTPRDRMSAAMVYGLKNLAISRASFVARFGVDMTVLYGPVIEALIDDGAVTLDDEWLRITPSHYIFADDICRQFFLPEYEQMMLAHMDRAVFAELTLSRPA